jgi:hypothetical protein
MPAEKMSRLPWSPEGGRHGEVVIAREVAEAIHSDPAAFLQIVGQQVTNAK